MERDMTRAKGSMHVILQFLAAHVDEWDSSTEEVARRDFLSKDHIKEMRGIDAWKIIARWHHEGRGRRLGEPDVALAPAKVLQLVLVHIAVLLLDDKGAFVLGGPRSNAPTLTTTQSYIKAFESAVACINTMEWAARYAATAARRLAISEDALF
ncbi:integrase catalytic domain-containing protein [Pseudoscourfieldia marina]